MPPKSDYRQFNVCDIFGDLDFDEEGLPILEPGQDKDKQGRLINSKGYLLDPENGNVINNQNFETAFDSDEMDDEGEVPAPFNLEKHNFNPHKVIGDFKYDKNGYPIVL